MPRPRARTSRAAKDAVQRWGRPTRRARRDPKAKREIDEARLRYYEGSLRERCLSARVPPSIVRRVEAIRRGRASR